MQNDIDRRIRSALAELRIHAQDNTDLTAIAERIEAAVRDMSAEMDNRLRHLSEMTVAIEDLQGRLTQKRQDLSV